MLKDLRQRKRESQALGIFLSFSNLGLVVESREIAKEGKGKEIVEEGQRNI